MKTKTQIFDLCCVVSFTILSVLLSDEGNYVGACGWWFLAGSIILEAQSKLLFERLFKLNQEILDGWKSANAKIQELSNRIK